MDNLDLREAENSCNLIRTLCKPNGKPMQCIYRIYLSRKKVLTLMAGHIRHIITAPPQKPTPWFACSFWFSISSYVMIIIRTHIHNLLVKSARGVNYCIYQMTFSSISLLLGKIRFEHFSQHAPDTLSTLQHRQIYSIREAEFERVKMDNRKLTMCQP